MYSYKAVVRLLYWFEYTNIILRDMARKNMTTSIENDLQKEIKQLAIDLERPFNNIVEEAFKDILK